MDMDTVQELNGSFTQSDLSEKYLTFHISEQLYGLSIANVIEIVQVQPVTTLPELPYYAKGIINLRGRIVPIIDINLRFGMPEKEYEDRTCIIIVDLGGLHVGFIVDAVEEVLDIADRLVSPPPKFSGGAGSRFVTGIANLERGMVLILDSKTLLSDAEMDLFGSIS